MDPNGSDQGLSTDAVHCLQGLNAHGGGGGSCGFEMVSLTVRVWPKRDEEREDDGIAYCRSEAMVRGSSAGLTNNDRD